MLCDLHRCVPCPVQIWDEMLDPVRDATCVVIGDTVATGTTLVGVLHHLLQYMEMCGNVVDVHVFTIAGSYACEPGLQEVRASVFGCLCG